MTLAETLLQQIETYLQATRMSERAFGIAVANNHKLISRLRAGLGVNSRTHDRIVSYMTEHPAARADEPVQDAA